MLPNTYLCNIKKIRIHEKDTDSRTSTNHDVDWMQEHHYHDKNRLSLLQECQTGNRTKDRLHLSNQASASRIRFHSGTIT